MEDPAPVPEQPATPEPGFPDPAEALSPPAAAVAEAPRPSRRRRLGYWLRENVRQLAAPLLAILLIRQYGVELYKIPTGSMAPTLYGSHFHVACTRCGWEFAAAPKGGNTEGVTASQLVRCPNCGLDLRLRDFDDHGGDKILANKWIYQVGDPRRWDVVVFRFYDRGLAKYRNYIKRLVGMPGDKRLEIRNGDIWIDGEICAKPPDVQDAVWIPVYDSRHENPYLRAWRAGDSAWECSKDAGVWVCRGSGTPAELTFDRPITNALSYNYGSESLGVPDAREPVGDVRVSLELTPSEGQGYVEARIRADGDDYVLHVDTADPAGSYAARRDRGAEAWREPVPLSLPAGKTTAVTFSHWDRRLRVCRGGDEIWAHAFAAGEIRTGAPDSGVTLACQGAQVRFDRIRIDRDLYYTQGSGEPYRHGTEGHPLDIGPGRYFFLGDNSSSSNDSRFWPESPGDPDGDQSWTVSRDKILGRASYAILYVEFDWPWKIPWSKIRIKPVR